MPSPQMRGRINDPRLRRTEPSTAAVLPNAPKNDRLRVIVLGGCEEVGRNCTLIEYKDDIILIDMGLEFPEEHMPGVDYIIPNMSYLKGKEKKIRGLIITHGHYDHIGAIPHTVPTIGNPPVFALPLSACIIKKRQEDFHGRSINLKIIKITDTLTLGCFTVHFVHINHNIPDAAGIIIETPVGTIVHSGDWKFDFHPVGTPPADLQKIAEVGKKGVLCLMGDSTNAYIPGHQKSEKDIGEELERIIEKAPGRVIIGTFASLLSRVKQIMEVAEARGKKIFLDGYSMKTNVEIAKELGFIKVAKQNILTIDQANKFPDSQVVILCTGAQGEKYAALNRIANEEHRFIHVKKTDTIIFSSSVIPGNEATVQRLKDTLYRKRAKIIHYQMMDVHAGGHGLKEDIKLMLSLFKPKYYTPIEGNHFMLRENADIAYSLGWKEENVFVVDNGQVMEFWKDKKTGESLGAVTAEKVPTNYIFVDGLGVGDVSEVVLRDRRMLAEDGMVIVIAQIEKKTGKLIAPPGIISRGFVYMKEHQELIEAVRRHIQSFLADKDPASSADADYIKNLIRDKTGAFLFQKTERRPMILPVLIAM
jgi:ribonuclease J